MGGCYNSGTTILREMLGSHPDIATLPREGVEMTSAFPGLETGGWQRMWYKNAKTADLFGHDPQVIAQQAARDWSPWWRRGASVFLEKSIVHGAWMPVLQKGFENAKFIGVIRNGFCACEGIRRRARPLGFARSIVGSDTYSLEEVGRQWVYSNAVLQRNSSQLVHYLEIKYEEFTANPCDLVKEIFRFIGVDDNVVRRLHDGAVQVGARVFRIQNRNADSFSRLSEEDKVELDSVIGSMMDRLHYVRNEAA